MNASSPKAEPGGVTVREQQERGWREFGEAANSPDLAVVSLYL